MDNNILVIGIAGGSASGKTTLMKNLIADFEDEVTVLSHDNYYKRHDDMTYEERSQLNYDEPAAFDTSLMVYHLEELRRVDPAALLSHVHPHEAGERAALILGRVLHGLRLRADQMRRRHVRVAEDGVLLQLIASSSSEALTELTPKDTISTPRRFAHFSESTSLSASAISAVCPGSAE